MFLFKRFSTLPEDLALHILPLHYIPFYIDLPLPGSEVVINSVEGFTLIVFVCSPQGWATTDHAVPWISIQTAASTNQDATTPCSDVFLDCFEAHVRRSSFFLRTASSSCSSVLDKMLAVKS